MRPPIYSKQAAKAISRISSPDKQNIRAGIEKIPEGNIKPLKGSDGDYRLRLGDWRIIFSYDDDGTVKVKKIGPRGDVYKGV